MADDPDELADLQRAKAALEKVANGREIVPTKEIAEVARQFRPSSRARLMLEHMIEEQVAETNPVLAAKIRDMHQNQRGLETIKQIVSDKTEADAKFRAFVDIADSIEGNSRRSFVKRHVATLSALGVVGVGALIFARGSALLNTQAAYQSVENWQTAGLIVAAIGGAVLAWKVLLLAIRQISAAIAEGIKRGRS